MSDQNHKDTAQQSLQELQMEISKLEFLTPDSKARLEQLAGKVEQQLHYPDEQANTHNLIEQLEHSVEEFEVEHPQLTEVISRVMHALSSMGI